MAAPMREGAPAGGPRPASAHHAPAHPAHPPNFEYDDNEWDIGIGDLIIDLDADIEKTDGGGGGGMAARAEPDAQRTALKMKIKRTKPGTKSSEAKHEIVKSNEMNGEPKANAAVARDQPAQPSPQPPQPQPAASPAAAPPSASHPPSQHAAAKRGSGGHRRDKAREKHPHAATAPGQTAAGAPHLLHPAHPAHPPHDMNGATRSTPAAPNAPGPPAPGPPPTPPPKQPDSPAPTVKPPAPVPPPPTKPEPSKSAAPAMSSAAGAAPASSATGAPAAPAASTASKPEPEEPRRDPSPAPPPAKKHKSEPKETAEVCVGTSVGTITEPDCLGPCEPGTSVTLEGIVWHETEGVLVVNVTWRGKTYVGTLLDCTRHDWAPPRFCDSPTEELDARTPKGRAKRGRGAIAPDLANFTETRSSVHSKLRNGGGKGRRAQPSPTPFTPPPRADPAASKRRLHTKPEDESSPATPKLKRGPPPPSSPPPDPVLLECPEPNCSKKYKHANGLKYHRSHAHGSPDDDDKDASGSEAEEPSTAPPSPAQPPAPATPTPVRSPDKALKSPEKPEPTLSVSPAASAPSTPLADKAPAALKPTALRFSVDEFPPASPFQPSSTDALSPLATPAAALAFTPTLGVPAGMPPPLAASVGPEPTSPTTPQPPGSSLGPTLVETSQRGLPTAPSPQFKVKPTASLMPTEERKSSSSPADESPGGSSRRARGRRSPGGGSPHPPERSFGREGVRSPAYSDISDDAAPSEEGTPGDPGDKPEPTPHVPPSYPVYQYYGQPPYLVSAAAAEAKSKEDAAKSLDQKRPDKECGKPGEQPPPPQKMLPQHFYPYGYMPPGFTYNVEPSYPPSHAPAPVPVPPPDDKNKEGGGKGSPGPGDMGKQPPPLPHKPKPHDPLKDPSKHPNENHQILKESIEMKSQMNPYVFQQRQPHPREEEVRRYYMSLEQQRRKEMSGVGLGDPGKPGGPGPGMPPRLPLPPGVMKPTSKEPGKDEPKLIVKEEPKIKQEGQKPTMETTGPPPPPTSQYYLPPYMQGPHYGALPFDPVYRGGINPMLVSAPFGGGWGGVGLPRYHAPEDLSRPPPASKPLDLLPSYYPPHKIHELSDHAKSPPGKAGGGGGAAPPAGPPPQQGKPPPPQDASPKESSRSPPPQRHVHTHHHTHVGLGYPLYPAPYGAAVLASQQAVVNSFPTTK